MKKQVLMVCASIVLGLGAGSAWAENPFMEKLPFAAGTIHYQFSGMEHGTETIYVDDYGIKSASYRETKSTMMGMTMETRTIDISDGQWDYSFDLVEGTGSKMGSPMYYMEQEYDKLTDAEKEIVAKNRKLMGMNVMAGLGGKVEENATELLGYSCDKVDAMGTVVHSIHGSSVILKSESNIMGMQMSVVATEVDTGKVDTKFFKFPDGIEPVFDEEGDAMSREMAAQTIAWLKDPEAASSGPPQMGAGMGMDRMQHVPQEDQADMMKGLEQMQEMMKGMQGMMPGGAGN